MIDLIYFSVPNQGLKPEDIPNILKSARDFNSKNNITGCLLHHNNQFLQILEGEKEIVLDLFDSIKKDKRHSNVILIAQDNKSGRTFSDWSMAFHEFDGDELSKKIFSANFVSFLETAKNPTLVMDLFSAIAKHIITN